MGEKTIEDYKKISNEAFNELFDKVDVWAKKYEEKGLIFQSIINFCTFDPKGNFISGEWDTNIESLDLFNNMNIDVIENIKNKQEKKDEEED